jgi:hypothetical protein
MPDQFWIPFLSVAAVGGWALACALLLVSRKWESLHFALMDENIRLRAKLAQKTPHERGAATRMARVSESRQRHIDAIRASIIQ